MTKANAKYRQFGGYGIAQEFLQFNHPWRVFINAMFGPGDDPTIRIVNRRRKLILQHGPSFKCQAGVNRTKKGFKHAGIAFEFIAEIFRGQSGFKDADFHLETFFGVMWGGMDKRVINSALICRYEILTPKTSPVLRDFRQFFTGNAKLPGFGPQPLNGLRLPGLMG